MACKMVVLSSVALLACTSLPAQQKAPDGIRFEVVSMRVLSADEVGKRARDFIGHDVVIRLRLSSVGTGFYFYTWPDAVVPLSYKIQWVDGGLVWLFGRNGQMRSSPGLNEITFGLPGAWRLLSAQEYPAIEWEVLDSTRFAGQKRGLTIFIKVGKEAKPIEILSEPYVVPTKP